MLREKAESCPSCGRFNLSEGPDGVAFCGCCGDMLTTTSRARKPPSARSGERPAPRRLVPSESRRADSVVRDTQRGPAAAATRIEPTVARETIEAVAAAHATAEAAAPPVAERAPETLRARPSRLSAIAAEPGDDDDLWQVRRVPTAAAPQVEEIVHDPTLSFGAPVAEELPAPRTPAGLRRVDRDADDAEPRRRPRRTTRRRKAIAPPTIAPSEDVTVHDGLENLARVNAATAPASAHDEVESQPRVSARTTPATPRASGSDLFGAWDAQPPARASRSRPDADLSRPDIRIDAISRHREPDLELSRARVEGLDDDLAIASFAGGDHGNASLIDGEVDVDLALVTIARARRRRAIGVMAGVVAAVAVVVALV